MRAARGPTSSPLRGLIGRASIAGATTLLFACPSGAEQSSLQQRCINSMNSFGARVLKVQNAVNRDCVNLAGKGLTERLGTLPQEQSAQACLTNDVKGKVAKKIAALVSKDDKSCLLSPEQLPDFAYAGATAISAAAVAQSTGVIADLFGPDLDLAIVDYHGPDRDGARCQIEVVKRVSTLFQRLWTEARLGTSRGLRGSGRVTGNDPKAKADSGPVLQSEAVAYLLDDARGKAARDEARIAERAARFCDVATTPIASMFPGVCSSAANTAELGSCAAKVTRARFFQSLAGFEDYAMPCDLTDDGRFDISCAEPGLVQHILDRTAYGADTASATELQTLGVVAYLESQLDPNGIDDSATDALLTAFPSLAMDFNELRANYPRQPLVSGDPRRSDVPKELRESKFVRGIATKRQLAEMLADFWYNHYNVDGSAGHEQWDTTPYDRDAIRPYVLGRFEDGLLAMTKGPAMMRYLDLRLNRVDRAINENFGREIIELHSMGVDAPFTEFDVVEASRALSGWRDDLDAPDGFQFTLSRHDQGAKDILNGALIIPAGGGEEEGIDLIEMLSERPETASFISRKLVVRFISENPDDATVARVADVFTQTGGDLKEVMREILYSREFLLFTHNRRSKVKRPVHLLTSALRRLGADPALLQLTDLRNQAEDMGEHVHAAGPPTGYPDASIAWTSPGAVILRFNRLERMARKRDGVTYDLGIVDGTSSEIVDQAIAALFLGGVSDETRGAAISVVDALAAENFDTRREQAIAMLLSSPEFLLH